MTDDRFRKRHLDCTGLDAKQVEDLATHLCSLQRDIHFWLGDLARHAKNHRMTEQVWPEWVSPGLIARCEGVAKAYPSESDRESEATYTQYMQNASKPDRLDRLNRITEAGLTSDESRQQSTEKGRWLLAFDVNYYVHRFFHSGAGVEAGSGVANWIDRLVERFKAKGLTDAVCCFDAPDNHRKALTADWEKPYKPRPPKDETLSQQLTVVRELLQAKGYLCVSVPHMEADDVMASYAEQFSGNATLVTQDKDARQCLSGTVNMLLDVEWVEDETTGEVTPHEKWVTAKQHTEEGCTYNSTHITGITPDQWPEFQAIAGDSVDGIAGVPGIGAKGAMELIQQFGTVAAVVQAADTDECGLTEKKRQSLIAFMDQADVTMQLVKMRTDLDVPWNTKIV